MYKLNTIYMVLFLIGLIKITDVDYRFKIKFTFLHLIILITNVINNNVNKLLINNTQLLYKVPSYYLYYSY